MNPSEKCAQNQEEKSEQEEDDALILDTFNYRIGGHTTILTYDDNTICKLAKFKERDFYENIDKLPEELLSFIPQYKGHIQVIELEELGEKTYYTKCTDADSRKNSADGNKDKRADLKLFYNIISKSKRHISSQAQGDMYIKLENLVADYRYPCILDIKMGQRQHDDNQTKEDQEKQIEQCKKTTSGELGAKIHGMQVYRVNLKDNYYKFGREMGNTLTKDQFYERLKEFFHDGQRYRSELIEPILKKLHALENILSKQMNKYRFYDSSILFSYDGYQNSKKAELMTAANHDIQVNGFHDGAVELVKVNIIDFTHVQLDKAAPDTPDEGYLLGLKNVIEKLTKIKTEI